MGLRDTLDVNQGHPNAYVSYHEYDANQMGVVAVRARSESDLDLILKSSEQIAIQSYHNNQLVNQTLLNISSSIISADCLFIPQLDEQSRCSDDKFVFIESASNSNNLITINSFNITEFDNLL